MRQVLIVILLVGLVSCDNSTNTKVELNSTKVKLDTFVNKVENSEIVDSIKSKGSVILDSVKSKGGKLVNKAEEELNDLRKKDSTK